MDNKVVTTIQVGGGGFLAWIGTLDLPTLSYVVGIASVIIGLGASLYWQWRKDRRDAKVDAAILESIKTRGVTVNGKSVD